MAANQNNEDMETIEVDKSDQKEPKKDNELLKKMMMVEHIKRSVPAEQNEIKSGGMYKS